MDRTLADQTVKKVGKKVMLTGWVHSRRDHGKIMFVDLRDRSGVVQLVSEKKLSQARSESVVEVVGTVKKRPDNLINPNIATGSVEVVVDSFKVLSSSGELPFPIDTDGYQIDEEIRNKYRYLDIRRPRIRENLKVRSKVVMFMRNFLVARDFIEVETPILTKTTPEGARIVFFEKT